MDEYGCDTCRDCGFVVEDEQIDLDRPCPQGCTANVFTCDVCNQTFPKGWTDEEATAEYEERFGKDLPLPEERATLCDDCDVTIRKWYEAGVPDSVPDKAMSGCGDCKLCCKLMGVVDVPPAGKPLNEWCQHCDREPGKPGCGIQATKPQTCAEYQCFWLASQEWGEERMPDWLRPDRVGFLINPLDADKGLAVKVDPDTPDAWRFAPVLRFLQLLAQVRPVVISHDRSEVILIESDGSITDMCIEAENSERMMVRRKQGTNRLAVPLFEPALL